MGTVKEKRRHGTLRHCPWGREAQIHSVASQRNSSAKGDRRRGGDRRRALGEPSSED